MSLDWGVAIVRGHADNEQIGVKVSANHIDDEYNAVAASYGADGGVASASSSQSGGMGGNGTMNGTAPSNRTVASEFASVG